MLPGTIYNFDIDFNFTLNFRYYNILASFWDLVLIDIAFFHLPNKFLNFSPLLSEIDCRNEIFSKKYAYFLFPIVALKNCWWYIYIIKVVKFYDIFFTLTFFDIPFFSKIAKLYLTVEGFYFLGTFSVFFIIVFFSILIFHIFLFIFNLPFLIYSFLKSIFLFFFNFFHILNYLLWGYYRLEENEEGDSIFFARPDPYYMTLMTFIMVMVCVIILKN